MVDVIKASFKEALSMAMTTVELLENKDDSSRFRVQAGYVLGVDDNFENKLKSVKG